jgi:anti-sigma-K factor RskA
MSQPNYPHKSDWEELLAGYVLGDLSAEEIAEMHQLIAEHPEIVIEIDRLQETLAMLPLGLIESQPPSDLRDRIASVAIPKNAEIPLASLLTNSPFEAQNSSPKSAPSHRNFWKITVITLSSISAIALSTLGFDNYQMRQQVATSQIEVQKYRQAIALLQSTDERMISLKGMGAIPAASGSVMIAPTEKTAMISIQNLRQIPQENSYRLWAIVDGKKVDCAQFRPDEQGKVFMKVPLGSALKQSTTLIITIEPNKDMPEPTGEMVMKGEV